LASLAAALVLILSQHAIASGELRKLQRWAAELELVVPREKSNLLSRSAIAELKRWPGLPVIELQLPLTRIEARALRKLKKLAVRVTGTADAHARATLKLLGPALVREERAAALRELSRPCAETALLESEGGARTLRLEGPVDACALRWLQDALEPKAQAPER
jgi:hypothetical protein